MRPETDPVPAVSEASMNTDMGEPVHHQIREHPFIFRSDALPARDRLDAWRDQIVPEFLSADYVHTVPGDFECRIAALPMNQLNLTLWTFTGGDYLRRSRHLSDGKDHFSLFVSFTGGVRVIHGKTDQLAGKAHAILLDYANPATGYFPPGKSLHRVAMVNIPRENLLNKAPNAENMRGSCIRSGAPQRLLLSYLRSLDAGMLANAELADLAGDHILDLVALALGPSRETAHSARQSAVRAARLAALRQQIEAHFRSEHFTAATAARALGISERYIHDLLAEKGESFSTVVNRHRLELAARWLTEPCYRTRAITEIALAVGFRDISYFNRLFRRQFGVTPRDFRQAALLST